MKKLILLTGFLFLLPEIALKAQVTGLWQVEKVQVGDRDMTPVAKWTHIQANGRFTTGNGWLQNGDGNWEFDMDASMLTVENKTGFHDPFGPFKVDLTSDNKMTWEREEEGSIVRVFYKRIEEKPKGPWDLAIGIWDLVSAEEQGSDILGEVDPEGKRFMFLRWDQLITEYGRGENISGTWRIAAHRPVLDILYYDREKEPGYWQISFEGEDRMILKKEETGRTMVYERLPGFPESF